MPCREAGPGHRGRCDKARQAEVAPGSPWQQQMSLFWCSVWWGEANSAAERPRTGALLCLSEGRPNAGQCLDTLLLMR